MTGGGFHADTESDPSKKKNVLGSALQGAVGGLASVLQWVVAQGLLLVVFSVV